jgi:comEA protein
MSSLGVLSLLIGCNGAGNTLDLDWEAGQTFHVAAAYKTTNVRTEESPGSLDGSRETTFGESWSDELIWTYQVVESGLVPEQGDELFAYAETRNGVASLAVVRAYLDDTLNDDPNMLEADPVVYLVFREDRDRLAAVISFVNVDGERVESAVSSTDLDKSWGALSQSMLTHAPTYLAPAAAGWTEKSVVLEDGSVLDVEDNGDGSVNTYFDDAIDGELVVATYEEGAPWPTAVTAENVETRLLSPAEVSAKRAELPYLMPEAPEDFDYLAALASSIDIDSALTLDADTIDGGWSAEVYEEFRPWAGSWWPLKKGELVFGYEDGWETRETYSLRIRDQVDPIKKDMDALSTELRDMEAGDEKDAKKAEYQAKQSELVEILVDFYSTLRQDLDGGRITIANGTMTHVDGWSYELDELSPMDKFALQMWADGSMPNNNPFYLSAWEILNSYNPAGGSWWGHCNGWAAAAILTDEPTEPVKATIKGEEVEYTTADLKGLLTESHYSTYSRFYGARYYKEGDDLADLKPEAFHKLITYYLKEQRIPLVFDTTASDAVWNFPAWKVDLEVEETTPANAADLVNINTAGVAELDTVYGVGPSTANKIIDHREAYGPFQSIEDITDVSGIGNSKYEGMKDQITVDAFQRTFYVVAVVTLTSDAVGETHIDGDLPESFTETWGYTLTADAGGLVTGGTWDDDSKHPDFAWIPYHNPTTSSNGSSENPFLPYGTLLDTIGDDFKRE